MIELADTLPDVNVQPAEYKRLLGYPREHVVKGRARELAAWARAWYGEHGHPWLYAREAQSFEIAKGEIRIEGIPFRSSRLENTLQKSEAHSVILVAVGAGPEAEREAQKLWKEEKPDEYFFLEMYASAVVEHLTTGAGARLCAWAEGHQMAVLPHYSPGYPEWDILEQARLLDLVRQTRKQPLPSAIDILASGMLYPKKSLLAVFGVTRHTERLRKLTELVPCENCSIGACEYRRVPYKRTAESFVPTPVLALNREAQYSVGGKALKRWADERLSLAARADGGFDALFRYEGTTCTNMGRPLTFHYRVTLGPREDRYPIRDQHCTPAPGDTGHTYMCRYMNNAEHLMVAIDHDKPLLGKPLEDVLSWRRQTSSAGCYCEPASREHKWGLVLETIHYALARQERKTQEALEHAGTI